MSFVLRFLAPGVLQVKGATGRIEVRGSPLYATAHNPTDQLHRFLDSLDPATVSVLMADDAVALNPNNQRQEPSFAACRAILAEPEARARRGDPATAKAAAASLSAAELTALQTKTLNAITAAGASGYTASEVAAYLSMPRDSISPRMKALVGAGRIMACGTRIPEGHTRPQTVWRVPPVFVVPDLDEPADDMPVIPDPPPEPVTCFDEPRPVCGICGRLLDQPGEPESLNCGGDCLGCVKEAEAQPRPRPRVIRLSDEDLVFLRKKSNRIQQLHVSWAYGIQHLKLDDEGNILSAWAIGWLAQLRGGKVNAE